jgi:alternate signal-mediated exported protein
MNKLIKGAVAGAAGIALLLGGAGTFAAWNQNAAIGSAAAINTGTLTVSATGTAGWYDVTNGYTAGQSTINLSSYKLVPGAKLEYRQPLTVVAAGDNLTAKLKFNAPSLTKGGTADANFAVSATLDGQTANSDGSYNIAAGTSNPTAVVDVTFTANGTDDQGSAFALTGSSVDVYETAPAHN